MTGEKRMTIGGYRWHLAPGADADEALSRIAAALAALAGGDAPNLKSGQQKQLYALRLGEGAAPDHLLKAYTYRWFPGLLRALRPSKSRRELNLSAAALARGLPVPMPLAAGERRRMGRLLACCLLVPMVRDVTDLRRLWFDERPSPDRRRRLATALGRFSRRVHDAGLFQDDFAPNNFLVLPGAEPEFLLVDFERARLARRLGAGMRRWMLSKLSRHMDDATASERMRFLKAYAGGDRREARRWWREIREFAPRLALRDHRRMRRNSTAEGRNYARHAEAGSRGFTRRRGARGALPSPPRSGSTPAPRVRSCEDFWCIEYGRMGRRRGNEIWARANTLWASGRLIPEPVAWMQSEAGGVLVLARGVEAPLPAGRKIEEARGSVQMLVKRLGGLATLSSGLAPGDIALGPVGRWPRRALLLRPDLVAFEGRRTPPATLRAIADNTISAARASSPPAP
ncbi:MAG: lipopolysaccharide kinase InaA family protein [Deltaproteobacteria bacterium]|nr:lipopolysaccharide kinase InaA family protein [Deltaproteobacteria bacterium]